MIAADASAVVAALVDGGRLGRWAGDLLSGQALVAPHLMPAEVANIIRRSAARGDISHDLAAIALGQLLDLRQTLMPFQEYADRTWELRENLTVYDAWYVAVAEDVGVPLATLDRHLARAPGPRCEFVVPD